MSTQSVVGNVGASRTNREINFDLNSAQPPINQYIGKDDQLFVMDACATAGITIQVFARMLMPDGTLQQNQWNVVTLGLRNAFFTPFPLPECFLLSLSVVGSSPITNNLYVQISIARGLPTLGFQHLVLCKGYCTTFQPLSWPWGVNTTNVDCVGNLRSITGSTPVAGADISETVPVNAKWRLYAIKFSLTCSASVGNRVPTLLLDDGVNAWARSGGNVSFAAGTTEEFTFAAGFTNAAAGSAPVFMMLPNPVLLLPGWRIRTSTFGLLAGDQYTNPQYMVEEWLLP